MVWPSVLCMCCEGEGKAYVLCCGGVCDDGLQTYKSCRQLVCTNKQA